MLGTRHENYEKTPEAVFLVMLGTSSFLARHEIYGKTAKYFLPISYQAWLKYANWNLT